MKKKVLKRIISCILIVAMLLPIALPSDFQAKAGDNIYGDANGDGNIDLKDALAISYYMANKEPSGFKRENADVNSDSLIDFEDLLMLKKYLAEWDIKLEPQFVVVSFYDGDRVIDSFTAEKGRPLSEVPSVEKSSKPSAVLVGYYTDKELTQPFYADNPVMQSMNVYAKYQEMGSTEELKLTSFARMDQSPDLSFDIQRESGNINPEDAVELIVKDGSDPVELSITDTDNDNVYTVKAADGFRKGSSYELTLAEGWVFKDKEATIRTAAFSIAMEEVENLQMSDDIIYIQDTESMNYMVDGNDYEELDSHSLTENGGSFEYDNAATLNPDDILCIYVGKNPVERSKDNSKELQDPAVYVKVMAVNGNQVTFAPLDSEDQTKLYNIPDNFPIKVDKLPDGVSGSVNISGLDREMYETMMGEDKGTYENALNKIAVGDFITLYTSEEDIAQSEDNLYYGVITGYNEENGEITYKKTTEQAILESMDLYATIHVSGDDLVTEEEKEQIEGVLLSQIQQSNFAEEAAYLLSDVITKTDGFRENMNVKELLLSDENGNPLSDEEIRLLNIGSSFELSDDIELSVELITSGDQLHFGDGVQLAVKVEATFEVDAADGKVAIDLSATFVEEVTLKPSVRGGIVKKKILGIPIPIGVKVNASVDIKNYTAFSFEAEIYTVAEEEKSTWEKIQSICKDPTEILGLPGIPDGIKDGLKTVGDAMDKIKELESKINKATDTIDKINGYKEDLEALWNVVEQTGLTTEEDWKQMGDALGKTSIASDLLELMDMTTDTEISTEYLGSMQELMDKYSEMLQKETDWIELVNKEIYTFEYTYYAIAVGVEVNFIVRSDMSIAIGSNLEYEVGKRYNFWFKIGLFTPTAGSSTMDILDEKFAFQFYVMGKLGVKAGIKGKIYVGLGTGKFASVGITAELGPYIKLYGFFVYEYTKYRPANSQNWTSKERMAGALYLEFGLYFILGFEANALGNLFEYSYDFLDEEIPLLTAGESRYYYDNAYDVQEDERVIVRDEDGNSTNGITMVVPDSVIALSYVDLDTGIQGSEALDYSRYSFTVSNPNFTVDPQTGVISVSVPENTRYMECDLTINYLYGKLAFSQYDMSVTVPIVWTNLSTEELSEYYTASVRVGNDEDGYKTVWTKRVLKNQEYDLPTDEEIKEMIGWSDAKYTGGAGYGAQAIEGLTLIQDMVYDYNVDYKTYSITVRDIQNADGTTRDAVYTVKYGESFDFSDLLESGMEKPGETYMKFAGVATDASIEAGGKTQVIDLRQRIGGKMAEALDRGIEAHAVYVDDSVKAFFEFTGINHGRVEQKLRKGTIPDLNEIMNAVVETDSKMDILDISPRFGKTNVTTVYQVICGELTGPKATIEFRENGGSDVPDITKAVSGFLGTLSKPIKKGYSFDGWYTDDTTFKNKFEEQKMPEGGAVLYAKWTANQYTVTFKENGGNELESTEKTKSVTYDGTYGAMPAPSRNGYAFIGWFTSADGGTEVTADTVVAITTGQTLYAHWRQLIEIPKSVFDFGESEEGTYQKGTYHDVYYTFNAGEESFKEEEFTLKYMRQGNSEYEAGLPINAGTYNVTISRPADNIYNKLEYTYTAVITINKAVRTIGEVQMEAEDRGYTFLKLKLIGDGGIDDLSSEAKFTYQAKSSDSVIGRSADRDSYIYDILPDTTYDITVKVTDDPNYLDAESEVGAQIATLSAPADSWVDNGNYDTGWYDNNKSPGYFSINTAEQLAGLSYLVNNGVTFENKTITLTADVDMRGHKWLPIGYNDNCWFRGTFDGGNHKITGLYYSNSGAWNPGLFGKVKNSNRIEIKNILLDHSYIYGGTRVGGIVGYAQDAVTINNCVNYARIYSKDSRVGGILGMSASSATNVINCVNYGYIRGYNEETGGIVGYVDSGTVCNCANYGQINGYNDVGGIVGQNETERAKVYNNFNVGTVKGTNQYIGAIIGRNKNDDGSVHQAYYLQNSASCNGSSRKAAGSKDGAVEDDRSKGGGINAAYFTSPTSALSRRCETDTNANQGLLPALNHWATRCKDSGAMQWEATGRGGYPLPKGSPIPEAMHIR